MDRVLGYGISAKELSKLIHCGPLRMDGVCNWVEICVERLQIEPVLFEGHIIRLIGVMKLLLCVPQHY